MPYTKPLKNRAGALAVIDSGDYASCQRMALEAAQYADFAARQAAALAEGRYLGIGLAHAVKPTGRGPYESARVRIGPSGHISVHTGALAMGQGLKTSLAQVCAEQLGVSLDDLSNIEVTAGDTGFVSLGNGRLRKPAGHHGGLGGARRSSRGASESAQGCIGLVGSGRGRPGIA